MCKIATRKEMQEKAIELLHELDIYEPYINKFKTNGTITLFEGYGGYYISEENDQTEIYNIVKRYEEERGHLVYAVTHEYVGEDSIYSLLIVTKYKEDWSNLLTKVDDIHNYVLAYCYNATNPIFSETGDIVISKFGGGIRRIG